MNLGHAVLISLLLMHAVLKISAQLKMKQQNISIDFKEHVINYVKYINLINKK